jgi:hypothetical protein
MRIEQRGDTLIIDDGKGAHWGAGALVPAIAVGIGYVLIWPPAAGNLRLYQGVLAFAVIAVVLAVLNPPRMVEFDGGRREVRIAIGWPPLLGPRMSIPFDTIREVKISQLVKLSENLGSARPVLVLKSGEQIFVSTYKRSPKLTREIVNKIRSFLDAGNSENYP